LRLPSVCSVAYYIDPLAFVPNTFYTHSLFKYVFLPEPWFTQMLWFKQKPGLCIKTVVYTRLLHKMLFETKTVLFTNPMFYTKKLFLLGLCKRFLRLAG